MHLYKISTELTNVIQGVGTLRMTRNFGDLPSRLIAVNVFGQLKAFLGQLLNFLGDVYGRFTLDIAQLFDFGFQVGNRQFKI